MDIRLATPGDAEALLAIYAPYVQKTAVSFEYAVPSLPEFRERIESTLTCYPYLVAEENGIIAGYAYVSPFHGREAYRHTVETSIYVRQDGRRAGVGRALYSALEAMLPKQNVYTLYACVTTAEGEDPYLSRDSVIFHEKLGFAPVAQFPRCGYKFGRWYGVMWLQKDICPRPEAPEPFIPFPQV